MSGSIMQVMPLLEDEAEEKKLILKSAKMHLDKVEERLRSIRSKQLLAKGIVTEEIQLTKPDVIENHTLKKSKRKGEDALVGGTMSKRKLLSSIDNDMFLTTCDDPVETSGWSGTDMCYITEKQETDSKDLSRCAISKAKSLLNKLASYNMSGQSNFRQDKRNNSSTSHLESFEQDSEETCHFSKMKFVPKMDRLGELGDVDKWRSKKLSHDLDKLFANVYDPNVDPVSLSGLPENPFSVLECGSGSDIDVENSNKTVRCEGSFWHLECLSVETQWDSQFVDSLQVKRVHMEAVKDWRRRRPLELLMSGCSKHLTMDRSSSSLPCVINDMIVCNMWKDLQRELSHQLGETSKIAGVVADSMLLQFSEDLDVLTESVTSYEQPQLSDSYKELLDAKKYLEQELGLFRVPASLEPSILVSRNSLLSEMEQQLEGIRVDMSSRQSLSDFRHKEFGMLSFKGDDCQKRDEKLNLFSNVEDNYLSSPWNVMFHSNINKETELVPSIEDIYKAARLYNVKRKQGSSQDLHEDYVIDKNKQDTMKVRCNTGSISNEKLEGSLRQEKAHSKDMNKRRSSGSKQSVKASFVQHSDDDSSSITKKSDESEGITILQDEKLFSQQKQDLVDTELLHRGDSSLGMYKSVQCLAGCLGDSHSMNCKMQIMLTGSTTEFQGCLKSLFVDKLGHAYVNSAENELEFYPCSTVDFNSTSLSPLKLSRSNASIERYIKQHFKCFDELCSTKIVGGERISRSSRISNKIEYGRTQSKSRERQKSSSFRRFSTSRNGKNKRRDEESRRKSERHYLLRTDRCVKDEKRKVKVGTTSKRPVKQESTRLNAESPVSPPAMREKSYSPCEAASDSNNFIPIHIQSKHKATAHQCPRFMQTFRQSQIAKRKSQREAPSSVFACSLFASSIPLPTDLPMSIETAKTDEKLGEQRLHVQKDMIMQDNNVLTELTTEAENAALSRKTSTSENSSSAVGPAQNSQWLKSTSVQPIAASVPGLSLLVIEREQPLLGAECSEITSRSHATSVVAASCPVRIFVFNQEKKECQLAEAAMTCCGALTFDPYNVVLLRAIVPLECLVLVHSSDLAELHRVPNLLRLKRDLRISFVSYSNVEDVLSRNFNVIYPRAGLVVMDTGTLIHCNPDHLEKMCQYMQKQETEKGVTWRLMISPDVANILNKHNTAKAKEIASSCRLRRGSSVQRVKWSRCELRKTEQQFAQLADVIARYCSVGIIDLLPGELFKRGKMSAFDYQHCCMELQKMHLRSYRHFLFVTDALKQIVDIKGFTESGIDVMSVPDFLRGFVGCGSTTQSKLCKEYVAVISTQSLAAYIDSSASSASEILLNKWNVPFTAGRST